MYSIKLYIFSKYILGNICLEAFEPKKLKKRYICSNHFKKEMYINANDPKSRLITNAVPNKYSSK